MDRWLQGQAHGVSERQAQAGLEGLGSLQVILSTTVCDLRCTGADLRVRCVNMVPSSTWLALDARQASRPRA